MFGAQTVCITGSWLLGLHPRPPPAIFLGLRMSPGSISDGDAGSSQAGCSPCTAHPACASGCTSSCVPSPAFW